MWRKFGYVTNQKCSKRNLRCQPRLQVRAEADQLSRRLDRHHGPQGWLNPTPHTLHPTPETLYPTPYTLHPKSYTLHPTPYTLYPTPYTLNPTPHTPHPTPYTLNPQPSTPNPGRCAPREPPRAVRVCVRRWDGGGVGGWGVNPQPSTLNPQP